MWTSALSEMRQLNNTVYGPTSFISYCKENNIKPSGGTANHISIDHFERLHKQLKQNHCMVFRLGSANTRNGTNFALVGHDKFREFFFFDKEIFKTASVTFEMPQSTRKALSIINLFDKPSEMMLVTYLLSSGVLGEVLALDKDDAYYSPLTGRNCFTFSYTPAPGHPKLVHENGQVEIDAVFTGKRCGKPVIVVAEAKTDGGRYTSLAKHKLYYAYKAVKQVCQRDFDVIPIYLKLSVHDGYLEAKIAECADVDGTLMGLSVRNESTVRMRL